VTIIRAGSDVARRINAERLLLLAWVRAIHRQLAHPLIAAGVARHSTFRGSPIAASARLRHTVDAMLALSFGTDTERDAAVEGIRAIHRRVRGTLLHSCGPFPAGTQYSAEDPALLTWVHATLVESMVVVYEELIAPLSGADRDRYCQDAAELAVALGASPRQVPRSWGEVRAYIDDRYASGEILVAEDALTVSRALICPFHAPVVQRLLTPALALVAAGLLPDHVRSQYGFVWNGARARRFAWMLSCLRRLRRVAPRFVALWRAARSADCIAVGHGYSTVSR
jgi:uncharacterized protein (DUF2236 family)